MIQRCDSSAKRKKYQLYWSTNGIARIVLGCILYRVISRYCYTSTENPVQGNISLDSITLIAAIKIPFFLLSLTILCALTVKKESIVNLIIHSILYTWAIYSRTSCPKIKRSILAIDKKPTYWVQDDYQGSISHLSNRQPNSYNLGFYLIFYLAHCYENSNLFYYKCQNISQHT